MLSFGMHVGSVPHRVPVTKHSYKLAYLSMVQPSEQLTRHSSPVTLFEHAVASHSALNEIGLHLAAVQVGSMPLNSCVSEHDQSDGPAGA